MFVKNGKNWFCYEIYLKMSNIEYYDILYADDRTINLLLFLMLINLLKLIINLTQCNVQTATTKISISRAIFLLAK